MRPHDHRDDWFDGVRQDWDGRLSQFERHAFADTPGEWTCVPLLGRYLFLAPWLPPSGTAQLALSSDPSGKVLGCIPEPVRFADSRAGLRPLETPLGGTLAARHVTRLSGTDCLH